MTFSELFDRLDQNKKGTLSRSELHESARQMGWHWHEAPVLAVLDLFTVPKPISKRSFIACLNQMAQDPQGPYGKILLNSPHFLPAPDTKGSDDCKKKGANLYDNIQKQVRLKSNEITDNNLISLLKHIVNPAVADTYQNFLENMNIKPVEIPIDTTALLIIDPQRSFTKGAWRQSIGSNAEIEVEPIRLAFEKCAQFLNQNNSALEIMFTRCPFPPGSYDWDDVFSGIIDTRQLYFIKPGNSVLFPPANGFREWVAGLIDEGKDTLVIAGCTLNSCVRVSSIETLSYFKDQHLQVVVDLDLAGARTSNFLPSSLYGERSAVESAVHEMLDSGVRVAQGVQWI